MSLSEQLRRAIETSGKTRYAIAKGAGVDYTTLVRFLDTDSDIRISSVGKIADFLGLELRRKKTGRGKGRRK